MSFFKSILTIISFFINFCKILVYIIININKYFVKKINIKIIMYNSLSLLFFFIKYSVIIYIIIFYFNNYFYVELKENSLDLNDTFISINYQINLQYYFFFILSILIIFHILVATFTLINDYFIKNINLLKILRIYYIFFLEILVFVLDIFIYIYCIYILIKKNYKIKKEKFFNNK